MAAEVARAKRLLATGAQLRREMDVARPVNPETEDLARFAAKVAHELVGCPAQYHPPELRWFRAMDRTDAYMTRGEHVTYLGLHLGGERLAEAVAHEAKHHAQAKAGTLSEASAEQEALAFGRRWGTAIMRAYHAANQTLYSMPEAYSARAEGR